jgi:hypothetical protein
MNGAVNNVRSKCVINANDIEMMLNAQGKAVKWYKNTPENIASKKKAPTWQSYKSYKEYTNKFVLSEVIRSK